MQQLSPDPLSLAAQGSGGRGLTAGRDLGPRGVAYVAAPGFDGCAPEARTEITATSARKPDCVWGPVASLSPASPIPSAVRRALIPRLPGRKPRSTGCGDVFGAAAFARLLAGDSVEDALHHADALAARNAAFRGASGLASHLRGELVTP